jgi:urate oxidase
MPNILSHNSYGKQQVRLTKVKRGPDRHELIEVAVGIRLIGDFKSAYLAGDNSQVVATDTMKNTVYALAADHPLDTIEDFALHLGEHFKSRNAHVSDVVVTVAQDRWLRVDTRSGPHPHAFVSGGDEKRETTVQVGRLRSVESSVTGLDVLKTTDSSFTGFLRDEFTTLPEATDRIFATRVAATWTYLEPESTDYNHSYEAIRSALIDTFAAHKSLSVQQTLYAMGEAALDACRDINRIRISMPNQHRIPFDLSKLGKENRNEIFVTTSEPYGAISGEISRG